jgi:hypothetical protein
MGNMSAGDDQFVTEDRNSAPGGSSDTVDWWATPPAQVQSQGVVPYAGPAAPPATRVVTPYNAHRLIGIVTVAAIVLTMVGVPLACWHHQRVRATDKEWQPQLVGVWVMRRDGGPRQAQVTLSRDGEFVYEDFDDETTFTGSWELRGGDITFTIVSYLTGKPAAPRKMVWEIKEFHSVLMTVQPEFGKPQVWRKQ